MIKYLVAPNTAPNSFLHMDFQSTTLSDINKVPDLNDGVILGNLMEFVPINNVGQLLKNVSAKLPQGRKIYISGLDISETARTFSNGDINIEQFNKLVVGKGSLWSLVTVDILMKQVQIEAEQKMLGGIGKLEYFYIGVKK